MADAFLKINKPDQSYTHYQRAIDEFQKISRKDHKEEISLYNKAALTCKDLKKALEYTQKSLQLVDYTSDNDLYHLQNLFQIEMEALRIKAQILERMGKRQDSLDICGQILLESESTTSVNCKQFKITII